MITDNFVNHLSVTKCYELCTLTKRYFNRRYFNSKAGRTNQMVTSDLWVGGNLKSSQNKQHFSKATFSPYTLWVPIIPCVVRRDGTLRDNFQNTNYWFPNNIWGKYLFFVFKTYSDTYL